MEQQEEKKIKIYGRTLPIDLVTEILLKLPTKSIVRSRCVSKLWSSITTDNYFINSFETLFRPKQSLLVFFKYMHKLVVFSFPQHDRNLNGGSYSSYSSQHVERYQNEYPKNLCFTSMESVQGLICFRTLAKPIIWNPSKRKFLTLPKPEKSWRKGITVFLGYDPIEGKHKLVCMPSERLCDECMVLTLGSSSSAQELCWRRIKTNLYHKPSSGIHSNGRCINGVLYYRAHLQIDDKEKWVVMSFDVRCETFKPIRLPVGMGLGLEMLTAYEGKLAFFHYVETRKGMMSLWVLEDAEKDEWSDKSFGLSFSHSDSSLKTSFKLSGVTDGGEFMYVPSTFVKSFAMLFYDPKRASFRKFVFEGIVDDEFRLKNRLGDRRFYSLQVFPNHIDSTITW